MLANYFRYPDGVTPNVLVLAYMLIGYPLGIALLCAPSPWVAVLLGVPLVAHTLIISAYLFHEFAHQSIFKSRELNERWGILTTWITGACYADFQHLRRKHMRHHVDRADVITFDFKAFLKASPVWFRKLVLLLEWAYVPAVELIMHSYVMVLPFIKAERYKERGRLLAILALRVTAFALLAWVSKLALLLYGVSYMIMLTVLRFTDAYQHTYDAFAILEGGAIPQDKVRDRDYEQHNTYSNVVSVAHPVFNLLLLNFSYHNAHHEKPAAPWYQLPKLHAELFPPEHVQTIPMRTLLANFHRYRVSRILADDYGSVEGNGPDKAANFKGAVGVSFLTAV